MSTAGFERNRRTVVLGLALVGALLMGSGLVAAADDPSGARTVPKTIAPGQALPKSEWVDVLGAVDLPWDTVSGEWRRDGTDVTTGPTAYSRIMLPVQLQGSYDLEAEFTRVDRDRGIVIPFPVGPRTCSLTLCGWFGAYHGLELIDGRRAGDRLNSTTRSPGLLINGQRYAVLISVRLDGDRAQIDVSLDGQPIIAWSGRQDSLSPFDCWAAPRPFQPALGAHLSAVTFHVAQVRAVSGIARMAPAWKSPVVDTKRPGWIDLLADVDLERDAIRGRWRKVDNGLAVAPAAQDEHFVRLMLPAEVQGNYDLLTEFTRNLGTDSVTITFPVIARMGTLHFSAAGGQIGGLEAIDNRDIVNPDNPAIRRPSGLVNGRRYQALIQVRTQGDIATVDVWLDGKPFTSWTGRQNSLTAVPVWSLPQRRRVGLGANEGNVTFHRVLLRPAAVDNAAPSAQPKARQGD